MTDEQRAELKRLAEAYARNNKRRAAHGHEAALMGIDPAAVLDLLAEREEDQGVIRVWRTRTEKAETLADRLLADTHRLGEVARTGGCAGQFHEPESENSLKDVRALWLEKERLKAENQRLRELLKDALACDLGWEDTEWGPEAVKLVGRP